MLKERLDDLKLGITELSEYLNLSRPTLYKYINLYDENKSKEVPKSINKLFDYINKNELIGKSNVINYIFNEILLLRKENENNQVFNQLLFFDTKSKKYQVIKYIIDNDELDPILFFLNDIIAIKAKQKTTQAEKAKLKLYEEIETLIKKGN